MEVNLGVPDAKSGCSGNALDEHCGEDLSQGGRTEHVHVGLYEGELINDSRSAIDPGKVFKWSISKPT